MKQNINGFSLDIEVHYRRRDVWIPVPEACYTENGCRYETPEAVYSLTLWKEGPIVSYRMEYQASYDTQMRLSLALLEYVPFSGESFSRGSSDPQGDAFSKEDSDPQGDALSQEGSDSHGDSCFHENPLFHVIPCNIFGDNHAGEVCIGEFPLLTKLHPEAAFCSPYWEFRADRAAMPVSALCGHGGVVAVSVDPYSEEQAKGREGVIQNGLFAELPNRFGVTLGYTNDPVTFLNRSVPTASTRSQGRQAAVCGRIYGVPGKGRQGIHQIVRQEYGRIHTRAQYARTFRQAAEAMLDTFCGLNFNREEREYTNRQCRPLSDTRLEPWRNVVEIGWTGGAILGYPLVMSRYLLDRDGFPVGEKLAAALPGEELLDRIVDGYCEDSGFFYDLAAGNPACKKTTDEDPGSRLNGWWTYYGLCRDCHCAYTQGSAVYYILKTILFLKGRGLPYPEKWLARCRQVLDTVVSLQREDGAFGYTYCATERRVLDWEGFAGCWFVPGLLYLAELTGEETYVEKARKAHAYYRNFVENLDCYGAPMDTWKAVDQEGNLSFLHGSRLLYEHTGEAQFLEDMKMGAGYEFLWRYGYQTRPENPPVNQGWNACGGSVTSISNPHIHPMGVLADEDLLYLGEVTGDAYYTDRAWDSIAWMMQTLELYPAQTGYGQYGVLSERWCPSDGLVTERYASGEPYSSWFSYNLWAAANVFEAVLHRVRNVQ